MATDRVKMTSKRQITLPALVCRALGIDKGDELEVSIERGELRLRPVPRFPTLRADSILFRTLGVAEGRGPWTAEEHDRILADEASARGGADDPPAT